MFESLLPSGNVVLVSVLSPGDELEHAGHNLHISSSHHGMERVISSSSFLNNFLNASRPKF